MESTNNVWLMKTLKSDFYRVLVVITMCIVTLSGTRFALADDAYLSLTFGDRRPVFFAS